MHPYNMDTELSKFRKTNIYFLKQYYIEKQQNLPLVLEDITQCLTFIYHVHL